jgi:hypothetical protein
MIFAADGYADPPLPAHTMMICHVNTLHVTHIADRIDINDRGRGEPVCSPAMHIIDMRGGRRDSLSQASIDARAC